MGLMNCRTAAIVVLLCLVSTASGRSGSDNMLSNGGFEKWSDDGKTPLGWHIHLTSLIPIPEYKDPENKKGRTGVINFKCGCGYMWGTVRPWTNLVCPKCKHMNTGLEDSADFYLDNHEFVLQARGKRGKGVAMDIPKAVGDVEGVRVISELVKAERDAGYNISLDARSSGPHLRVFVECFREIPRDGKAKKWIKTLSDESNPQQFTARLKRVYRKQINCNTPGQWKHFAESFVPPDRYKFDYMFVTLYGYLQGEASYDNVVLRKLSKKEKKAYLKERPGPKDKRLR